MSAERKYTSEIYAAVFDHPLGDTLTRKQVDAVLDTAGRLLVAAERSGSAVCDHEPTPDIAESVARHAAAGQITSARKLLHDNSRLTWEEVTARVDSLAGKAGAR